MNFLKRMADPKIPCAVADEWEQRLRRIASLPAGKECLDLLFADLKQRNLKHASMNEKTLPKTLLLRQHTRPPTQYEVGEWAWQPTWHPSGRPSWMLWAKMSRVKGKIVRC